MSKQIQTIEEDSSDIQQVNVKLAKESAEIDVLEKELAERKKQHLQIAKLLQAHGIKAIQQQDAPIFKSKDALAFIKEGVELERKVLGMETQSTPQIVNIISGQQKVLDEFVEDIEE